MILELHIFLMIQCMDVIRQVKCGSGNIAWKFCKLMRWWLMSRFLMLLMGGLFRILSIRLAYHPANKTHNFSTSTYQATQCYKINSNNLFQNSNLTSSILPLSARLSRPSNNNMDNTQSQILTKIKTPAQVRKWGVSRGIIKMMWST